MHLQGLDLNLLIALDALLSERNVTRAAERMNISQPGMSAALQKLRYHFDDPLLERIGRRLELTARAQSLAGPVKSILVDIRNLQGAQRDFVPAEVARVFRIAATTYVCEVLAVPLLSRLSKIAPRISVQFEELSTDMVNRIAEGQLDFAITISARIIDQLEAVRDTLTSSHLFQDQFILAMSANNPCTAETLSFDELCDMGYAETRFAGVIEGVTEKIWKQQRRQPRIAAWLPNFQLALSTVGNSELVTIVPSLMIDKSRQSWLRAMPVPFDIPQLEEQLIWHVRNDNDPGHSWMVEQLHQTVQDLNL